MDISNSCIYIRLPDLYLYVLYVYRVSQNKRIGIQTTDSPNLSSTNNIDMRIISESVNSFCFEILRLFFFLYLLASEESSRLESEPLTLRTRHTPSKTPDDWLSDTAFVFFCPNEIFIKHGFSVTSRTNYNINNHRRSVSLFRAQQWVY